MSERITVRLADAADADAIGSLIHALDTHYRAPALVPSAEAAAAMARRTLVQNEGTHFALAFDAGEPAGLAAFAVLRPGRDLHGVLYIKEIFVRAPSRGRGIGTALLDFMQAEARRRGLGRIDLTTDPANHAAQRLYERHGGERIEKIAYRFWLLPE